MQTTLRIFLGLSLALSAAAQQPPQSGKAAEVPKAQRDHAIELCKANRGADCETDAGLREWLRVEPSRSTHETPAAAQQPTQSGKPAVETKAQRERAIELCKANRGVDCATDAGLREWLRVEPSRSTHEAPAAAQHPPQSGKAAEEAKAQRERAIELCKANRGVDCATDAGLGEWLRVEPSRTEAGTQGSRSIHQTAPVVTPQPAK